jgi:hemerythrin superfamily protein
MEKQFETRQQKAYEGDAITAADDIVDLILEDHKAIKKLLEVLKDEGLERSEKEECLEEFIPLLLQHAKAEEESLYAKMKTYELLRMHAFAGETEHMMAEEMVQKVNASPDDDEWKAKVKILAESVEHHITEEEDEILPEVERQMDVITRKSIGDEYAALKLDYSLLLMKPHHGPDWEAVIE